MKCTRPLNSVHGFIHRAQSFGWDSMSCPPTCMPTKLWVGNVRPGLPKGDVLRFCDELGVVGICDLQIIHRDGRDSSLVIVLNYDWQAAQALERLRSAGENCAIRSESGCLKVRYKESVPSR